MQFVVKGLEEIPFSVESVISGQPKDVVALKVA